MTETWVRPPFHAHVVDPALHQHFLVQSMPNFVERQGAIADVLAACEEFRGADGQNLDPIRAVMFKYFIDMTLTLDPGHYMECGTFQGHSARMIWRWMDPASDLYCFDTFEGFEQADITIENAMYETHWTAGNFHPTTVEMARSTILRGDPRNAERLHIVKGWLPACFEVPEGARWRFVHLDMDLYQPHKEMTERVWADMVPGGVLMMHDYNNSGFPGVKKAADEFLNPLGIVAVPLPDWGGSAVAVKPLR